MPFAGHQGKVAGISEELWKCYDAFVQVAFVAWHASLRSGCPVFGVALCWGVSRWVRMSRGLACIFRVKTYWSERFVHSIRLPRPAMW